MSEAAQAAPLARWRQLALSAGHFAGAAWRWRRLDQANLPAYQERRAAGIVAFAYHHSPFYRRHWQGRDPGDWRALPLIDKQLMMDNFSEFNTAGITAERALAAALRAERERDFSPTVDGLTVGLSSGTSGHRGLFLVSPREQAAWAGAILARTIRSPRELPLKVAFFLRSNSNLYEQVGGRLIRFRYFDLMAPLDEAIGELNRFQPRVVVGPPSLLGLLADAADAGALRISPARLLSVAEVLEPQDRERLARAFAAPVGQIYQCTEGLLAISCAEGGLHIQEDLAAIQLEPLGDGRAAPIITDLWRRTQPIIRYRLNDLLVMGERCRCGSDWRVIERIEGRCDDLLYFPAAGGRRPVFPDTIRRAVLLAGDQIRDYQALQRRDGELALSLELAPGADWPAAAAALERGLRETLAAYGCGIDELALSQGLPPRPPGAKRRRVARTAP